MFVGKARSHPRVEQVKDASLGKIPFLPVNTRLGLKRTARDKYFTL
jgi:hypothetical protein